MPTAAYRSSLAPPTATPTIPIPTLETWTTLRTVAGRTDFLYVADSKLCSHDNLSFIDRAGGRFVTVLPRSRREDNHFRKLLQTETPAWEVVWDQDGN